MALNNITTTKKSLILISNFVTAILLVFPVNAQPEKTSSDYLEDISAGKEINWQFSTTTKSISLKDEIAQLQKYDLSASTMELEREIVLQERKWDKKRNLENFSLNADIYQY